MESSHAKSPVQYNSVLRCYPRAGFKGCKSEHLRIHWEIAFDVTSFVIWAVGPSILWKLEWSRSGEWDGIGGNGRFCHPHRLTVTGCFFCCGLGVCSAALIIDNSKDFWHVKSSKPRPLKPPPPPALSTPHAASFTPHPLCANSPTRTRRHERYSARACSRSCPCC